MWDDETEDHSDVEESEETPFEYKPNLVIIALDTHLSMFIKSESGEIPFRNCLQACYELADSLIFNQDKRSWNPFAVALAKEDPGWIDFKNNILESVKFLKSKLQLTDKELQAEFERKGNFDLTEFFLGCKKLFHDVQTTYYKRTLLYITNNDAPIKDQRKKFTAMNEIKTFPASQIDFQVIPTRRNFNFKLFYNELCQFLPGPHVQEVCVDVAGLSEKLSSVVVPKRRVNSIRFYPFKDDQTRFIKCILRGVVQYSNLNNIPLTKDGKRIKTVDELASAPSTYHFRLRKNDSEKAQIVSFDNTEVDGLMDYSYPKGYTLLYIAKSMVTVGMSKQPVLMQDTKDTKDINPYFKQFWNYCVNNDRVLVCMYKHRQPARLNCVQLCPIQANKSPAFVVKRIPFANEICFPQSRVFPKFEEDPEKRKVVEKLVNRLTFEFNFSMIPDLSLRKKKAYVKAKLLDEPEIDIEEEPFKRESLDSQLEDIVQEINSKFTITVDEKKRKYEHRGSRPFYKKRRR